MKQNTWKRGWVIDKRPNIAASIYTETIEGINIHKYGTHIFILIVKKFGVLLLNFLISTVLQIE